jgi:hypothetical protein
LFDIFGSTCSCSCQSTARGGVAENESNVENEMLCSTYLECAIIYQ